MCYKFYLAPLEIQGFLSYISFMFYFSSHLGEKETITPVTSLATDGEPYHVLNSGGTSIKADEAEVSKTDENYTN